MQKETEFLISSPDNTAQGKNSTADGCNTIAYGNYSHAEGFSTRTGRFENLNGTFIIDSGRAAHAEGEGTVASGWASHSEGMGTIAYGDYSHSEGFYTTTGKINEIGEADSNSGWYSHAEGMYTTAAHVASHAEGSYTQTGADYQTVLGKYNVGRPNTLFEVGNGDAKLSKNAFEVYTDGHAEVQNIGKSELSIITKKYLNEKYPNYILKLSNNYEHIIEVFNYDYFEIDKMYLDAIIQVNLLLKFVLPNDTEEEILITENIGTKTAFNLKYVNGYFKLNVFDNDLNLNININKVIKKFSCVSVNVLTDTSADLVFNFKGQKNI